MAFGFNKGLQTLTVQEAQNASLGQLGSVYLDTAATTFRGVIIYGRWSSVSLTTNGMACICYMG